MPNGIRIIYSAFRMAMLHWIADPQWVIPNIIAPFVFTIVALTLFGSSSGPFGLYAVLGGGMMGVWGNTLYSSGFAIEFEKWQGTLEEVLAAPSKLLHVIAGRSVCNALLGLINMVAILAIAAFLYGVDFSQANIITLVVSVFLTAFTMAGYGLLIGGFSFYFRDPMIFANIFTFILLIFCGVNFPVSYLPPIAQYVSYAFPLTYGIEAARAAIAGSSLLDVLPTLGWQVLIGVGSMFIGYVFFRAFENTARRTGRLEEQ